jgi:ribosomal protein L22
MTEEPEKPRRRRRRRRGAEGAEDGPAAEATRSEESGEVEDDEATRVATPAGPTSASPSADDDELEAGPDDVEAEEATEVVLEADDEAEEEPEDEDSEDEDDEGRAAEEPEADAEAPARRRGLRRGRGEKAAAPPPASAPRRRRRERDPSLPPPVVRAQAKYVRSSARKARLVCDHIRGKSVEDARAILAFSSRSVARDWSKLLESAVANAEHNHELVGEDLYIKAVHADEGPTIKRFRPRAMGRATRIRKRTSHLTILLTPKE